MRFPRFVPVLVCITLNTFSLFAQSPNGNINGLVSDPSSAAVVGAEIVAVNDVTSVQYTTKSNKEGIYVLSNLPPGPYRIQVSRVGFKTVIKPDIVLNVQDALSVNFTLPVGALHEVLTVEGGASLVNTESAAVSTVVDRQYVENMPLNGRSFQDLILLTPGVVTNTPQDSAIGGRTGEFSVNGQRAESNYYSVDGVSANIGIASDTAARTGVSGSLPSSTALGTTQSLVSLDALEEFRVATSTYSAENGRNPGGQFSFVTKSGTDDWHATAFEYLRNDALDASDWFNGYFGSRKPALRQNDFGGTLGGPVGIPHLYNGRDTTFFFLSYEGLRLIQPQAAAQVLVPNLSLRGSTPLPLQEVLNAFPVPTGADFGNGLAPFVGAWSDPGNIDALSARFDHVVHRQLRLFFRFGDTTSGLNQRNPSIPSLLISNPQTSRTFTLGATSSFGPNISDEFRFNFSLNKVSQSVAPTSFGGAVPVNLFQVQGLTGGNTNPQVELIFGLPAQTSIFDEQSSYGKQKQWNVVDTIAVSHGRHQFKLGFDYRQLQPEIHQVTPNASYYYFSVASLRSNNVDLGIGESTAPAFPAYVNFSAFAQDEWKANSRLTISTGLRWELNPAPGSTRAGTPYTVLGNSPATFALAPQGTPLWATSWYNFAPRVGVAYVLRGTSGFETVVRSGGGVFFDTGQQTGSNGYLGPGFSSQAVFGSLVGTPAVFPAPVSQIDPEIVNPPVPPYGTTYAFPEHLQLPYTLQWNASVQQGLGSSQAVTISYVGAAGRRLLQESQADISSFNPSFTTVVFTRNGLTSDYDALQLQYQRRLTRGLQALASYTWSHSIDYGSSNYSLPYLRGNSDFDVRNNLSGAFSYDVPANFENRIAGALLAHWGIDNRFTVRTGFPVTLDGNTLADPATGQEYPGGLDRVSGQPLYISGTPCALLYGNGRSCPGGRAINPNAFDLPSGNNVGDAPRNFVSGFGAWQLDFAIRRNFALYERVKLQFRTEAFNIFNHPNFGTINATYCSPVSSSPNFAPGCTFGQAQGTLASGLGGLNPLYQMGGPRSLQVSLRLFF